MGIQAGIPLFYLQHLPFGQFRFKDNFADSDLFWGWRKHKTDAQREVTEANGVLKIGCSGVGDYDWNDGQNECPKVIISPVAYPCEIVIKILDVPVINDYTQGGLLYSSGPTQFGSDIWFGIVRRKIGGGTPFDGIAVVNSNGVVDWTLANTDVPVWFKLRLGNDAYRGAEIKFYYSYDGVNFTFAFGSAYATYSKTQVGICLAAMNGVNAGANQPITMDFDSFEMKPKTIN